MAFVQVSWALFVSRDTSTCTAALSPCMHQTDFLHLWYATPIPWLDVAPQGYCCGVVTMRWMAMEVVCGPRCRDVYNRCSMRLALLPLLLFLFFVALSVLAGLYVPWSLSWPHPS